MTPKVQPKLQIIEPLTEKTWGQGWVFFDSENKMAEQSAKHFTRFTAKYCLKSKQEQQEDTSTDDICYSEYIRRPKQTFLS